MISWMNALDPNVLLWLVLIVVFIVAELISVGLTSIWFAAGSLSALVCALLHTDFRLQFVVFAVVSILLLLATRPLARKFLDGKAEKTNADLVVGEVIRILERVSNIDQTGMAQVLGKEWTVRTENDDETIEAGEFARVLRISGVKLIVKKED